MKKGIIIILAGILGFGVTMYFLFSPNENKYRQGTHQTIDYKKQATINNYNEMMRKKTSLINTGKQSYETLVVALPDFWYTKNFHSLAEKLKQHYQLPIKYIKIPNLKLYQSMLKQGNNSDIDLFLIPNEWKNYLSIQKIDLGEYIGDFFDPLTSSYAVQQDIFPFGLDPVVVWDNGTKDTVGYSLDTLLTFYQFEDTSYLLPLVWDTTSDITTTIIFQALKSNTSNFLEGIKKLYTFNFSNNKQQTLMNKIIPSLSKKTQTCDDYPYLCMLSYGFASFKYGYFSEQDITKNFTGSTRKPLHIEPFPYHISGYPIRMWGFVFNAKSKKYAEVQKFLQYSIGNFSYHNLHIIPAIVGELYYKSLLKKDLIFISGMKDDRYIIDNYDSLFDISSFWKLVKSNASLAEYWRNLVGKD